MTRINRGLFAAWLTFLATGEFGCSIGARTVVVTDGRKTVTMRENFVDWATNSSRTGDIPGLLKWNNTATGQSEASQAWAVAATKTLTFLGAAAVTAYGLGMISDAVVGVNGAHEATNAAKIAADAANGK